MRPFFSHAGLVTASLLLSLLLAELALRAWGAFDPPTLLTNLTPNEIGELRPQRTGVLHTTYVAKLARRNWHKPDTDFVWAGQVGRRPEFLIRARWNNMACHDNVHYGRTPPTPLILMLGDSFVEAVQVPTPDTFYSLLRRGPLGAAWSFYGCGWSGWSPVYAAHNLNSEIPVPHGLHPATYFPSLSELTPNTIIYFVFSGNDLRNEALPDFNRFRLSTDACRDPLLPPVPSRSLVIQTLQAAYAGYQAYIADDIRCISDEYWPYFPQHVPVLRAGYERIEASIALLKAEADKRASRFVLALIEPYPVPYGDEAFARVVLAQHPRLRQFRYDLSAPSREFSRIAATMRVPFFSASIVFANSGRGDHYYPSDMHLSPEGHRQLAKGLYAFLSTLH